MKRLLIYILIISLISCTTKRYHDGRYKGTVYAGGSFFNTHEEVLTVDGGEILVEKYTIGGNIAEKLKVTCTQYSDRIEFKELGGVTKILTVLENGDLQLSADIIFKKLDGDEPITVTKTEAKPLIRNNNDGTITILPDEKEVVVTNSKVETTNHLFTGTRKFSSGGGWEYMVTIKGNQITLKLFPDANNEFYPDKQKPVETILGFIEGSKIITADNTFKIEKGALYELNNEGGWNEYIMINN